MTRCSRMSLNRFRKVSDEKPSYIKGPNLFIFFYQLRNRVGCFCFFAVELLNSIVSTFRCFFFGTTKGISKQIYIVLRVSLWTSIFRHSKSANSWIFAISSDENVSSPPRRRVRLEFDYIPNQDIFMFSTKNRYQNEQPSRSLEEKNSPEGYLMFCTTAFWW